MNIMVLIYTHTLGICKRDKDLLNLFFILFSFTATSCSSVDSNLWMWTPSDQRFTRVKSSSGHHGCPSALATYCRGHVQYVIRRGNITHFVYWSRVLQ